MAFLTPILPRTGGFLVCMIGLMGCAYESKDIEDDEPFECSDGDDTDCDGTKTVLGDDDDTDTNDTDTDTNTGDPESCESLTDARDGRVYETVVLVFWL